MELWKNYTVIDLEMTGLAVKEDKIMEIGAAKVRDGRITETYGMLVNPHQPIPERVQLLTGITTEMVAHAMEPDEAMNGLLSFIGEDVIVGQNIMFDYSFIKQWAVNHKKTISFRAFDTLKIARALLPAEQPKKLEALCSYYGIKRENAHRALDDAIETHEIFQIMMQDVLRKREEDPNNSLWVSLQEPKELQYKAKKQTPATKYQVGKLKELVRRYGILDEVREIHWETLSRSQASRFIDFYYARFGREAVNESKS